MKEGEGKKGGERRRKENLKLSRQRPHITNAQEEKRKIRRGGKRPRFGASSLVLLRLTEG